MGKYKLDQNGNVVIENQDYGFNSGGGYNAIDPVDNIINSKTTPPPRPTNVPGKTPGQAASDAFAGPMRPVAPKITKTPSRPAQAANMMTIWNPNANNGAGAKKAVPKGTPLEKGWSLWTGGNASVDEAKQAIFDQNKDVSTDVGKTSNDIAADSIGDTNIEDETTDDSDTGENETTDKWETPQIDEILSGFGIDKLETTDFTEDYNQLEQWKTDQLDAIDTKYEGEYEKMRDRNEKSLSSLQAKLIKAGVSLDGMSFESATASEVARGDDRIAELDRLKAQEEAAVENGYTKNYLALSKEERDNKFDTMTTNINNMFKGYNLATNIWESFNKRDAAQREAEQKAQEHLDDMMLEWAKLDDKQRADRMNMMQSYAEKGLYDIYDENTVDMLYNLEKLNGLQPGELVDPATGGYWNRMSNMALKDAQTENMMASTNEKNALLPYKVAKYQTDIAKAQAAINEKLASQKGGEDSDFLLRGAAEKLNAEARGEDGYYDSRKYVSAMNEFVKESDPKLKNEKYYKDLFMNYFPPTKLLNPSEEDKASVKLRSDFTKSLKLEDLFM